MSVADVHGITKRGDLLEVLYGDNSILTIHNFFDQSTLQGGFVFNNGEIWSKLDILKHTVVGGTDGNDFVYGFNEAYNEINSGAGDDTIYAGDLGANIVAGAGNDLVFGGISDDEINGGNGDDILNGNSGQDSFYFAKGDGNDEIVFTTFDRDLSDKVILTDTQSTEPVSFTRIADSLVLRYSENDTIKLKDFFYDNSILSGGIVFSDQVTWSRSDILAKTVINGTNDDDQIWGFNGGFNNIFAKAGNDLIYVGDSGSMVDAGEGNDTIYGGADNDTLIGGKGDDTIQSGSGLDTFYFSKGDGKDTLQVNNYDSNPNDRIVFTDIVSTDQVKIARVGDSLILNYSENDSITFKDFFYNDLILSGGLVFADQVTWSRQDILERTVINGTDRDDQLWGFNGGFNNIFAKAGNDLIYVGDSGSRVDAGEGNDTIYGGAGNGTMIGGKGDDALESSRGLDTFVFSKGDRLDTIITPYNDDNANDKIIFSDVLASDIRSLLSIDGSLVINYADNDKITVKDFFASESILSGGLILSDHNAWSRQDLLEKAITQGSSSDDSIFGNNQAQNKIFAGAGNDTIFAGSKGSTIFGQGGDDLIQGGAGSDQITGGTGNDAIHRSAGGDTYLFQLGDGQDTIFTGNLGIDPNDRITFSRLTSNQANFEKNDADLVIKYGIDDELLVKEYFADESIFGGVQFDDVVMTKPQIENSISTYSPPELTILGQSAMQADYL